MHLLRLAAAIVFSLVLVMPHQDAQAQNVPRINVPVSQAERIRLDGNTPGKLRLSTDEGPVEPGRAVGRMMLMMRPSVDQQAALQQLLTEQQDRTSPNYHKWLTPEEYATRFGVADADIQTVSNWLVQQGFTQIETSRTHRFISFTGTAGNVQSAFATQLHRVRLDGQDHLANVTAPSIPAAFSGLVSVIMGLDDFSSTALHGKPVAPSKASASGEMTQTYFTPTAFAEEYDVTPLQTAGITGAGVTVVVVGQTAPSLLDLNKFQNMFSLPQSTPTVIPALVGGTGATSDAEEAALDLEWISAVAPGARLVYDFTGSSYIQALADAVDNDRGQIISVSYGDCESYLTGNGANENLPNAINSVIELGNALGITVVAASGDQGATCVEGADGGGPQAVVATNEGLAVLFPATAPTVTAVGGTQFVSQFSNTSTYVSEQAWNETGTPGQGYLAASGGGASAVFSAPSWQNTVAGYPSGNTQRLVPDVALNASHNLTGEPYEVIYGAQAIASGQTSAATATFAGVLALVQQYLLQQGISQSSGLGNANPLLYELFANQSANSTGGNTVFHDIITGNNMVTSGSGSQIGFSTATGYDEVTGLGSVDVSQLATWWGYLEGTPVLSISPQILAFPSQPQGTPSDSLTLTLSNSGKGLASIPGDLTPMGTNASSFSIDTSKTTCGTQILPGASCLIAIDFTPAAGGELFAYLPIISGNVSAQIPLSGMGVAPSPSGTVVATYPFTISSPTNTGYGGGPLIQASDGNFYGVNAYGGASTASGLCSQLSTPGGCGTIYKINPQTGIYTLLYSFMNGSDGAYPSSIIQGPDGNLYGTALLGGLTTYPGTNGTSSCTTGCGTLFEYVLNGTPPGNALNAATRASVYEFGQTKADGQNPNSLTLGADGRIYGTTLVGGTNSAGTIFVFTPENIVATPVTPATIPSTIHSLPGGTSGSYPETLVQGTSGLFYGMTQEVSGTTDYGSVFQVDTSGNYKTLYSFQGETDSANVRAPSAGFPQPKIVITQPSHAQGGGALAPVYATPKALVQYSDGNFYGTTAAPSSTSRTVFKMTPSGALTTLYTFTGKSTSDDGGGSLYGLTLGSDANFYGVSDDVIFRMTPSGLLTSLYTVSGPPDPQPGFLLYAADGSLVSATIGVTPGSGTENACPDSTAGSCGYVFDYVTSPALTAPVQLSFSQAGPSSGYPNFPFILNWQVLQATSLTAQQCYAFLSGGTGGGTWTGKQTGALVGSTYMGTTTITPTAAGTYTYSLTCGGTLTGSVTVNISKLNAYITLTASSNLLAYGAPVTLTATVFNPAQGSLRPSGTVWFGNGVSCSYPSTSCANLIGSESFQVDSGTTMPLTTINASYPSGQNVVEFAAYYPGDANFAPYYTGQLIVPGDPLDSVGYVAVNVSSLLAPGHFSLPTASVGRNYSAFLTGVTGGTPSSSTNGPSYTYSSTPSSLPPGLRLLSTGQILGTPTTVGSYQFTVTIGDSAGDPTVTAPAYITVSTNPLQLFLNPDAVVGAPYSSGQIVSGGTPPYTYQMQGSLPPGLSFNFSTGILSGTPTSRGTFYLTFTAMDSEQPAAVITETIPLIVNVEPLQLFGCNAFTFAQVPFSCTLSAYGGNPPYTWTISAGSLPVGLSLNSATGVISGTPTVVGTSSFEAQEGSQLPSALVTSTIVVYAPLTITSSILPTGEVGSPYGASLTASGGSSEYTWTLVSGTLPPGVSLNSNGIFSGSPTQPGTYPFIVEVTNSNNTVPTYSVETVTASLSITVNSGLAITSPAILTDASVSSAYSVTLGVAGGVPGYYWTIASGMLPSGLKLDQNTGVIYGTPSVSDSGAYTFAVQVTDSEASPVSISKIFTIYVNTALRFVPLPTPCRVVNTGGPNGSFGGPALQAQSSREFDIPQGPCNIPSSAVAYSINITAVPFGSLGYLTAYPSGQAVPMASTLNSVDGRTKANAAIVPAGGVNGGVSIFVTDETNAIVDIDGYFVSATSTQYPTALQFYPLTPCRVVDTRLASGPLGAPSIAGNSSRAFPVLSGPCQIPSTAQAYSLNVTAVVNTPVGYLTVWPTGQPQPNVSLMNVPTGTITANSAIVSAAGTNGEVSVFVTNNADVLLDINGYFAPPGPGGLSLYTTIPCRVEDSRFGQIPFPGTVTVNGPNSSCGLPATAAAYVLNATVVPNGIFNFLTLYPAGQTLPVVSTLNAFDGAITNNLAIVPLSNGSLNAYAPSPGNVILDISSYFAP